MTLVGVRELRQRASELLRRVARGETFEITDRGRPVAVLGPLPDAGPLARRRASAEVSVTAGDPQGLPEPLPIPAGQEPPSAALQRLRDAER